MFDCVFICHRLVFKACGFLIIFHLKNAGVSLFGATSSVAHGFGFGSQELLYNQYFPMDTGLSRI